MKHRAEAYFGHQNEDISRLRNELAYANSELQQSNIGRTQTNHNEREIAHMNEVLSSELLMSKANSQHHEAEVPLIQSRSSILQSEVANLQSIIQSQKNQQVQKEGFTEEKIKSHLLRKVGRISE